MTANIFDGKALAATIQLSLKKRANKLMKDGTYPHLMSVQIGMDQVSEIYVRNQQKACKKTGVRFTRVVFDKNTSQDDLIEIISTFNQNKTITGIIIQMPTPDHLDPRYLQSLIIPTKDVEGVCPKNVGSLALKTWKLVPCTPLAIMELLKNANVSLKGKEVCVVGHSEIVGKPIALMLLDQLATLSICHHATIDLKSHTEKADVLISATGKVGLIKKDMVKEGAVIIDVGFSRVPELNSKGKPIIDQNGKPKSKIVGDVDFNVVKEKVSWITPVPGGVGPLTTMMLIHNTILAAESY